MSVGTDVDIKGLERLQQRIARIQDMDLTGLKDAIGAEVESQTRRRLDEEKGSSEGDPWEAWSARYAATRHGGNSLLVGQGDLLDSMQYLVDGNQIVIGTNLIYGATHQFGDGDRGIPERPYLGLSDDNLTDLEDVVDDWVDGQLEAL